MIEHFPFAPTGQTILDGSPSTPAHIGIVPDGNRRWSHKTGATTEDAYIAAARKALEAVGWCREAGVRSLSAFALSQENVAMRPTSDVSAILPALALFCSGVRDTGFARLEFFGDFAGLVRTHPNWRALSALAGGADMESSRLTVYVGINYSGQRELLALARGSDLVGSSSDRPLDALASGAVPALDLVIRSGGQQRLSGFLPLQTAYAELWFSPTLWPDFTRADFEDALLWYSRQERRLGE